MRGAKELQVTLVPVIISRTRDPDSSCSYKCEVFISIHVSKY